MSIWANSLKKAIKRARSENRAISTICAMFYFLKRRTCYTTFFFSKHFRRKRTNGLFFYVVQHLPFAIFLLEIHHWPHSATTMLVFLENKGENFAVSVVSSACSQCAIFLKKKVSHSENCFINKIAIERDPKLQHFLVSCHLLQKFSRLKSTMWFIF